MQTIPKTCHWKRAANGGLEWWPPYGTQTTKGSLKTVPVFSHVHTNLWLYILSAHLYGPLGENILHPGYWFFYYPCNNQNLSLSVLEKQQSQFNVDA